MPNYRDFTIYIGGQNYSGHFHVYGDLVHVGSAYGSKAAKLGKHAPAKVAENLLIEIVAEWRKRQP